MVTLYDAEGTRVLRQLATTNARTTVYVGGYEEDLETGETRVPHVIAGRMVGMTVDGVLQLTATDHLGSSSVTMDTDGDNEVIQRYTPFGANRSNQPNQLPYDKTFTGQTDDPGTGLIDYNARHYDPTLGRFIMADTLLDGLNRYTYVRNNPLRYTDPTGKCNEELVAKYGEILGDPNHACAQYLVAEQGSNRRAEVGLPGRNVENFFDVVEFSVPGFLDKTWGLVPFVDSPMESAASAWEVKPASQFGTVLESRDRFRGGAYNRFVAKLNGSKIAPGTPIVMDFQFNQFTEEYVFIFSTDSGDPFLDAFVFYAHISKDEDEREDLLRRQFRGNELLLDTFLPTMLDVLKYEEQARWRKWTQSLINHVSFVPVGQVPAERQRVSVNVR